MSYIHTSNSIIPQFHIFKTAEFHLPMHNIFNLYLNTYYLELDMCKNYHKTMKINWNIYNIGHFGWKQQRYYEFHKYVFVCGHENKLINPGQPK